MQAEVALDAGPDDVPGYIQGVRAALEALDGASIGRALAVLERAYLDGRTVFVCGNGGSAATASHFAVDLGKGTRRAGAPGVRVVSLVDHLAALTAFANDEGYESVFAGQLTALVTAGDVVVGITTSGNSPNVVEALRFGRQCGAVTIALLGPHGGNAREFADVRVHVAGETIEQQEDAHLVVAHAMARHLRRVVHGTATAADVAKPGVGWSA